MVIVILSNEKYIILYHLKEQEKYITHMLFILFPHSTLWYYYAIHLNIRCFTKSFWTSLQRSIVYIKKKAQDADTLCRNGIDLDGDDQMGDVHVSRPDKLGWVMATNTTGVTSPAPCPRNKNTREPRRPPKNATAPRHGFLSVPACTQHSFLVAECDRPLPLSPCSFFGCPNY